MVLAKRRNTFLNGGVEKEYSEKMAEELDEYVKKVLDERYKAVLQTLKDYAPAIEKMVEELYKTETITGEQVVDIIKKYEEENGLESRLTTHEEADEDIKKAINR